MQDMSLKNKQLFYFSSNSCLSFFLLKAQLLFGTAAAYLGTLNPVAAIDRVLEHDQS
jgi:hypothetical protein